MSFLKLPKRFGPEFRRPRVKPTGPVEVDFSKTITDGLKFLYVPQGPNDYRDLVSGQVGTPSNITQGVDVDGWGIGNVTDNGQVLFPDVVHDIGHGAFTMMVLYKYKDGGLNSWLTAISLPNNNDVGLYVPRRPTDLYLASDSTSSDTSNFGDLPVVSDEFALFGLSSIGNNTKAKGWKNGASDTGQINLIWNNAGTKGVTLLNGQGSEYGRGRLYAAAVFNRLLSDAEQIELSRGFYRALLKPATPQYFIVPDVSSTPVSSDSSLQWSVLNSVLSNSELRWSLLNAVENSTDLQWAIINSVESNSDLRWSIINSIASNADLNWSIKNAIVADSSLLWSVLNAVNTDSNFRWSLLNSATLDRSISWGILGGVSSDVSVKWSILNSLLSHSDLRWSLLNGLSADTELTWSMINAVSTDADVKWAVLESVNTNIDLRWSIAAALGTVSSDLSLQWSLLSAVQSSLTAQWDIFNSVTKDADLRWSVLNAITADLTGRWDVVEAIQTGAELHWSIVSATESDMTLRWSIESDSSFQDLEGVITLNSNTPKLSFISLTPRKTVASLTPKITLH